MPTYSSPGVYVEEVPSGSALIAGVGTSTAGFIGVIPVEGTAYTITQDEPPVQSVPAGQVKLCTNFSEFKKYFGDLLANTPDKIKQRSPHFPVMLHNWDGFLSK